MGNGALLEGHERHRRAWMRALALQPSSAHEQSRGASEQEVLARGRAYALFEWEALPCSCCVRALVVGWGVGRCQNMLSSCSCSAPIVQEFLLASCSVRKPHCKNEKERSCCLCVVWCHGRCVWCGAMDGVGFCIRERVRCGSSHGGQV